jgi:two-component system, NtrC family, nitrogen regulation sensor histidine kinase NtrY
VSDRSRPIDIGTRILCRVGVVAVAATGGTFAGWSLFDSWAVAAGAGIFSGVSLAWWALRPVTDVLAAAADGLLSFRERDFSLRIVADGDGALAELAARFNALGEMLRAERRDAYQKEMLLEMIVEAAPTAILLADEAGTIIIGNGTARQLLGTGKRLIGQRLGDVVAALPPSMRDEVLAHDDVLFTVPAPNGETQTFHSSRRFFELNTQRHVLYLVKPLTRELSRQEAETWKKAIRVISHEIANSLAPVSSLVHSARALAAKGTSDGDSQQKLERVFDTLADRAQHLSTFLEGYARFARLPKPVKQAVPWAPFLEGLHALYPFRIEGELPDQPGWFDRAQLQQAVINLLKNAVESGGPQDEIAVQVRPLPEGAVQLDVLDRGAGMSDEVLARAFLPFSSTKQGGSGLGLPLCREIVEAHGGQLAAVRREGGGTTVHIRLPGQGQDPPPKAV